MTRKVHNIAVLKEYELYSRGPLGKITAINILYYDDCVLR